MLAPAAVPKAIVDRLNEEIKKAMDSPEVQKRMEHLEPWLMTPEQAAARIRSDYDKQGQLIRLTGASG
jgi:tripartite-type tricarboxylate transporter receptor subunit TctC